MVVWLSVIMELFLSEAQHFYTQAAHDPVFFVFPSTLVNVKCCSKQTLHLGHL